VSALVAFVWAGLILGAAFLARPPRSRLGSLTEAATSAPSSATRSTPMGAVEVLGATLLALGARATRRPQPDRLATRPLAQRVGAVVLAAGGGFAVVGPWGVAVAPLGWLAVSRTARRSQARRFDAIAADLPEVVDLLGLAVGAGLNISLAIDAVARRGVGPLSAELRRVCDEVGLGRRLADALEELPTRAGEAVRPLVAALLAGERYGVPLSAAFERLALDTRADQRRRAETAARRVPVTMLFPLVTCVLPAFALLTVAPLIAGAFGSLRL